MGGSVSLSAPHHAIALLSTTFTTPGPVAKSFPHLPPSVIVSLAVAVWTWTTAHGCAQRAVGFLNVDRFPSPAASHFHSHVLDRVGWCASAQRTAGGSWSIEVDSDMFQSWSVGPGENDGAQSPSSVGPAQADDCFESVTCTVPMCANVSSHTSAHVGTTPWMLSPLASSRSATWAS